MDPLPLQESVLCSFVSYLAVQGLRYRSIKVYLSAVRHMQIEANFPDPFTLTMARLEGCYYSLDWTTGLD